MNPFHRAKNIPSSMMDIVLNFAITLLISVGILLMWINDPTQKNTEVQAPVGKILVELLWDNSAYIDLDLWTQYNGQKAVGYPNKNSDLFDLLRDDLGGNDISGRNYEIQVGKDVLPGQYAINVVWYGGTIMKDIEAKVIVTVMKNDTDIAFTIFRTIKLNRFDEVNVFVFEVDEKNEVIRNSVRTQDDLRFGVRPAFSGRQP